MVFGLIEIKILNNKLFVKKKMNLYIIKKRVFIKHFKINILFDI